MTKYRVLGLILSFALAVSLITGCGSKKDPAQEAAPAAETSEDTSEAAPDENAAEDGEASEDSAPAEPEASEDKEEEAKTLEAALIGIAGKVMTVDHEKKSYKMDISEATINTSALHAGDTLSISYKGELSTDDASACKVISVASVVKAESVESTTELVGTLENITMNSITLRVIDGRILTFNSNNAKQTFSYGLDKGNWVTVIYKGELVDTNTSDLAVIEIHDEDTPYCRQVKAQTTIKDADDTVYALEDTKIHSSFMMASDVVGDIKAGDSVKRTGHCNNGWDRIIYNGKEAYVYGTLLTESSIELNGKGSTEPVSQKVNIKELDETVYAKTDANVRENYSTASNSIGAMKAGTSAKRTGICDNGWSRIIYNGGVAYVFSDLLTTKDPNSKVDGVKVTDVNELVYASTDVNIREKWSVESKAIGSLKLGEEVTRTGICDNGWSRISFNNKDAYIRSDLLTKTDPKKNAEPTIYKTEGYAWTTAEVDVMETYSAQSKAIARLPIGSRVKITGVTDSNWSRIDLDGKTGFVYNDLLTSENPDSADVVIPDEEIPDEELPDEEPADEYTEDVPVEEIPEGGYGEGLPEETAPAEAAPAEEVPVDDVPVDEFPEGGYGEGLPEGAQEIRGVISGYDLNTITIKTEETVASEGEERPADEPEWGEGDAEEYPSTTYEEAEGEESTYYTFDISEASQDFSKGTNEGIEVTVTYTGDLENMEDVKALSATDSGTGNEGRTFRGVVISSTENTVTILSEGSIENTFNIEEAEVNKEELVPGAEVSIIADIEDADLGDNILKSVKIEIIKDDEE